MGHCTGALWQQAVLGRRARSQRRINQMLERAELEPWQARPRGYSRQKGRFIQGINQLKAAGWEKVVCLAARAALSFTTARRAHSLIYGRLQVIKEVSKRNDQATTFCHWTSFFRYFHVCLIFCWRT